MPQDRSVFRLVGSRIEAHARPDVICGWWSVLVRTETFLGNARGGFGDLGAIGEDDEDQESEDEAPPGLGGEGRPWMSGGGQGASARGVVREGEGERVVATDVPQ